MSALGFLCFSALPSSTPLDRSPNPPLQSPRAAVTSSSFSSSVIVAAPPSTAALLPELPFDTKEKILYLELMGIDSAKSLSLNPSLRSTPLSAINSTISLLLSRGLRRRDLPRIFGMCPSLLTADGPTAIEPVFRFLSEDLGVPGSELRRPVNKCPRLLASSVPGQLRPALGYLRGLGIGDTVALAYRDPVLLVSSVERTLAPKLEYLRSVGYSREEAEGMVRRCPGLFTFSIENNFVPKLRYYLEEMEGRLAELREFPQFFAFSLERRIRPRHRRVLLVDGSCRGELPLDVMLKATDDEFERLLMHKKKKSRRRKPS